MTLRSLFTFCVLSTPLVAQDALLPADTIGQFLADEPEEMTGSSSGGLADDPFAITPDSSDGATEAAPPTVSHEISLPEVSVQNTRGPYPTDPTSASVYSFNQVPFEAAVRSIADEISQPVVLELVTNVVVSDDYSGLQPLDALLSLADDYGFYVGEYHGSIYIFEPGTAGRIAQRLVKDRAANESTVSATPARMVTDVPSSDHSTPVGPPASRVDKSPTGVSAPSPARDKESELQKKLKALRARRAELLTQRNQLETGG